MVPFEPFFRNRHLSTIAANFWPRDFSHDPFPEEEKLFDTDEGVCVLGVVQQPRDKSPLGEVILLHGLEGSHSSGYMVSMAYSLVTSGFRVTRLNMRSCGGTEKYCKTLYHAGLTADMAAVVRHYQQEGRGPIFLAGFSLGGNVVLKFTGESGDRLRGLVAGAVSISTPIDLAACCRQMMRLENRIYERRFLGRLKDRYRQRCAEYPEIYQLNGLDQVRSVYGFDDVVTAPYFKFGTAENYYRTQSANNFIEGISIPTLMIQAEDDPLIPFSVYSHPAIAGNPQVSLVSTPHGGHVGFISRYSPRFWADQTVREWMLKIRNKS